ncbi:aminotransferase classes i and ii family protein [Anaeramoeba flamelloides]|uniref:Aminotransferase classes i and ii family protein n=1 Tax=Anaeramoeba flamelloides TaxID=1746091 RepID=A0AAV7YGQ9_9EUKA|nr:aminotransferase classes i and ii family protein [Anaeramoeba flamelloides]|eukprot:Anaeramoba_flamelloidesa825959_197.p1 GENE.a825959_197~~a825959_197.p1  ORF type:complete len:412 (+),score=82.87 a825959_197:332-1567(+)
MSYPLSNRVQKYLKRDLMNHPLVKGAMKCASSVYSKENQEGFINLGTAMSDLNNDKLYDRVMVRPKFPVTYFKYGDSNGTPKLLQAFKELLEDHMGCVDVNVDHISMCSGCGVGVSIVCQAVTDVGDGVLVPVPCYSGFDFDLFNCDVNLVRFKLSNLEKLTDEYLQENKIKALLLTNPDNPMGTVIEREELVKIVNWCQEKEIHLISDEIYALEVFDPEKKFVSVMSIKVEKPELVTMVYGLSKDFCIPGWRTGVIYSKNEQLMNVVKQSSFYSSLSKDTMLSIEQLLCNHEFRDNWITNNRKMIHKQYLKVTKMLDNAEVPYAKSTSAFFFCLDLRKFLKEPERGEISEIELHDFLLDNYHVQILAGMGGFYFAEPGWFRMCYALEWEIMETAMERLIKGLNEYLNTEK